MIIRNFLFHRVSDEIDNLWPPMQPAVFKRIVQTLSRRYQVISLEQYLNGQYSIRSKKKLATILFDDGYKDNIEYAAPILQQYNCPASFYIVTDCIDKNIPTWTYILDFVIRNTNRQRLFLDVKEGPEIFKCFTTVDISVVRKLKPWIKTLSNQLREKVFESLLSQCDDVVLPAHKMMGWGDVKELFVAGFIIGSHSHTHPMLAQLENEEEIEEELSESFERIKSQLHQPPQTISYPIGSYDERVKRLSEKVGYQIGLAVEQKFYSQAKSDYFAIPRVELYQEPWWKIEARMNGIYNRVKGIWK